MACYSHPCLYPPHSITFLPCLPHWWSKSRCWCCSSCLNKLSKIVGGQTSQRALVKSRACPRDRPRYANTDLLLWTVNKTHWDYLLTSQAKKRTKTLKSIKKSLFLCVFWWKAAAAVTTYSLQRTWRVFFSFSFFPPVINAGQNQLDNAHQQSLKASQVAHELKGTGGC